MQAQSPSAFFAQWRRRLDQPIATTLLLSLSLHLALLLLVQPAPGGGNAMEPVVIQARLVTPTPASPASEPEVPPESMPDVPAMPTAVAETPPLAPPQSVTPPLLTSHVPSPAPPLPVAPTPIHEPRSTAPILATPAPVPVVEASPAKTATAETRPAHVPAPAASAVGQAARSETSPAVGVGIDTTWYLARQVDRAARATDSIVPDYPEEARRRNQEGTLKLMVKIDDLGRVRDVEVVEADIPGLFDAAALAAFRGARFQPAMKDGRPVRYQAYIRVVFRLRD